ncbi:MAG: hypothetical protein ACOY94_03375 [Bacillota bacterium]
MELDRYYPTAGVAVEYNGDQPEELSLKRIDHKIPGRLPRRNLEGMEPLVAALDETAAEHRERTAEERARKGPRGRIGA